MATVLYVRKYKMNFPRYIDNLSVTDPEIQYFTNTLNKSPRNTKKDKNGKIHKMN